MSKPRTFSMRFDLGEDRPIDGVRMGSDGRVDLMSQGKPVSAQLAWAGAERDRQKGGKKTLFTIPIQRGYTSEAAALSDFDRVFVIDTNTKRIRGETISAASFAVCSTSDRLGIEGKLLFRKTHVGCYEFRGAASDQERIAWVLLQEAIIGSPEYRSSARYLIITDHALGSHPAINARSEGLLGDIPLADGIFLGFATGESGPSICQKALRECDKFSAQILKRIAIGELSDEGLGKVSVGPMTHFRHIDYQQPPVNDGRDGVIPNFPLSRPMKY